MRNEKLQIRNERGRKRGKRRTRKEKRKEKDKKEKKTKKGMHHCIPLQEND